MKTKWTTKFPTKEGNYWFYGYRYGKISCGHKCKPELMYMKVFKCANGLVHSADGQFVYEKELEEAHFAEVDLPDFPKLKA